MIETETTSVTPKQAWELITTMLKARLGQQVFDSWFGSMKLEAEKSTDGVIYLSVANTFLVGRVT